MTTKVKIAAALVPALFTSCAGFTGLGSSTVVRNANGRTIFATSGESVGLAFSQTATETHLSILTLNHKPTTDAQWKGVNNNLKQLVDAYSKFQSGGLKP